MFRQILIIAGVDDVRELFESLEQTHSHYFAT